MIFLKNDIIKTDWFKVMLALKSARLYNPCSYCWRYSISRLNKGHHATSCWNAQPSRFWKPWRFFTVFVLHPIGKRYISKKFFSVIWCWLLKSLFVSNPCSYCWRYIEKVFFRDLMLALKIPSCLQSLRQLMFHRFHRWLFTFNPFRVGSVN